MSYFQDLEKSLNELEGPIDYSDHKDSLVKKVESVRRKKIKNLMVGDLALLLRQQMSLEFIVPLCLSKLNEDILAETERAGFRLLIHLMNIDKNFWLTDQGLYHQTLDVINNKMDEIINPRMDNPVELDSYVSDELPGILKLYQNFILLDK